MWTNKSPIFKSWLSLQRKAITSDLRTDAKYSRSYLYFSQSSQTATSWALTRQPSVSPHWLVTAAPGTNLRLSRREVCGRSGHSDIYIHVNECKVTNVRSVPVIITPWEAPVAMWRPRRTATSSACLGAAVSVFMSSWRGRGIVLLHFSGFWAATSHTP